MNLTQNSILGERNIEAQAGALARRSYITPMLIWSVNVDGSHYTPPIIIIPPPITEKP